MLPHAFSGEKRACCCLRRSLVTRGGDAVERAVTAAHSPRARCELCAAHWDRETRGGRCMRTRSMSQPPDPPEKRRLRLGRSCREPYRAVYVLSVLCGELVLRGRPEG